MYYYLFEPVYGQTAKRWQNRFKEKLVNAGIAGESVVPSPARMIDELIQMGLDKGLSTTIAVGGDLFINKVASSLIYYSVSRQRDKIVLGAVPTDSPSYFQKYLPNLKDELLIDVLRARYLLIVPTAFVQPNKFLLCPATISRDNSFSCTLKTPHYQADLSTTLLTLEPTGSIRAKGVRPGWGLRWLLQLFTARRPVFNGNESLFRVDSAELTCEEILPITLRSEVIAKTPIIFRSMPGLLHLIVDRSKVEDEQ